MTNGSIDIHAHILDEETMGLLGRQAPELAPSLTALDADHSLLRIAGLTQDPFYRGGWDLSVRLRDMDDNNVDMQLLSVCVQAFLYDREARLAADCARLQNEQIAAICRKHPTRFMGIATLPLQAPQLAADELAYAIGTLGLKGAEIGSNVNGRNLDDPALDTVWETAERLGGFILVHPHAGAASERLGSYYLKNFVGLPFETTTAIASLVFGGVLERFPGLKICFSHGGGFAPYQYGRFLHGWEVRAETKVRLRGSPADSLARLFYDTILHDSLALEYLVRRADQSHVMLGSDYPFDMGNFDCVAKVEALDLPDGVKASLLGGSARAILHQAK
jgi:aminocarboxymuconate-semialdehyde decarboxylase